MIWNPWRARIREYTVQDDDGDNMRSVVTRLLYNYTYISALSTDPWPAGEPLDDKDGEEGRINTVGLIAALHYSELTRRHSTSISLLET